MLRSTFEKVLRVRRIRMTLGELKSIIRNLEKESITDDTVVTLNIELDTDYPLSGKIFPDIKKIKHQDNRVVIFGEY